MNRQKLIDAYATYFKLGYNIHFKGESGIYFDFEIESYRVKNKHQLHLLDTVVLLEEEVTGDWLTDVVKALQTTPDFIRGVIFGLNFEITTADRPS